MPVESSVELTLFYQSLDPVNGSGFFVELPLRFPSNEAISLVLTQISIQMKQCSLVLIQVSIQTRQCSLVLILNCLKTIQIPINSMQISFETMENCIESME